MDEEHFDVVDARDRVIGRAPRSEVHARKLLHRAVHVFVFDRRGRLLLQKRSADKDEFPLCYTSSASGHVDAGEFYDDAAKRELQEELGLSLPLERLVRLAASPQTAYEHTVLYRAVTDTAPQPHPGEIERIESCDLDEITARLERAPERFAPPFRVLFRWYRANRSSRSVD